MPIIIRQCDLEVVEYHQLVEELAQVEERRKVEEREPIWRGVYSAGGNTIIR